MSQSEANHAVLLPDWPVPLPRMLRQKPAVDKNKPESGRRSRRGAALLRLLSATRAVAQGVGMVKSDIIVQLRPVVLLLVEF